ncbi:unnamed protein product [Protopolystoma xenopodis]|uniref:Immunoglobulin I-set domain-containing protein n=1 Tax=Protopolystoma xenopodis TaxID=117903 RepID=A0A3S5AF49_9PLAT|nr:unnamed protein product [Protopolystoma xenopodis]
MFFSLTGIPLEFIRKLEDISLSKVPPHPIVLEAELSRKSKDSVIWLKDGKPLKTGKKIRLEEAQNGLLHRVILDQISEEDVGVYTIFAEKKSSTGNFDLKG